MLKMKLKKITKLKQIDTDEMRKMQADLED